MANVSEYKKKIVKDIIKLAKQYKVIGVVNMQDLPAPQLQSIKAGLRGKINLFMTKKRFMKIALESVKNEKKNIEELEKYLEGMPALLFTNEDPFKLSRLLQKSKTKAPAKAGQIAPSDIKISKGPTPFAPGPVISELSSVGLKVGVENGKIAIKEDTVVAKKGEKIKPKVAEILTRLDIKPMEVGLGLIAAYEDGIIYLKDVLEVDETEFNNKISLAATQAFNLAFNIAYPTKDNIKLLIAKAFNDAKALGISQKILDKGIIEDLLGEAERSMLGLKNTANIETVEQPTVEQPKEEKKEEVKEEVKEEPKKQGPKPAEKKIEAPTAEKVEKKLSSESEKLPKEGLETQEKQSFSVSQKSSISEKPKVFQKGLEKSKTFQKEEKILEEEKKIIEEEKKLEEEKPKDIPSEQEVQEEVKQEEEINLEKERIQKEKELERVEDKKDEIKKTEEKQAEPKPEDEIDKKVRAMVEKTKKFSEGKEETANDILKEVNKEEEKEVQKPGKKESKAQVPSTHDLKVLKKNSEKEKNSGANSQKEVEKLAKELIKKGTLRKK